MLVGAEGDRRSRLGEFAGGTDAVGEVGLRARAHDDRRRPLTEGRDVRIGQVCGMDRGEPLRDDSGTGEHLGRGRPVGGDRGLVLRRLFREVDVEGSGDLGEPRQVGGGHRTHRVDRGPDGDEAVAGGVDGELRRDVRCEAGVPVEVALDRAVAEAGLLVGEFGADAAGEVAGVEEADPDPRRGGARASARSIAWASV